MEFFTQAIAYILLGAALGFAVCFFYTKSGRTRLETEKNELQKRYDDTQDEMIQVRDEKEQMLIENSGLKVKNQNLEGQLETQKEQFHTQYKQFTELMKTAKLELQNANHDDFAKQTETFKQTAQEKISQLISPLDKEIKQFKESLGQQFTEHGKEQYSLKNAIDNLRQVSQASTQATDELAKALKSDSKTQGTFGETQLETLLQSVGFIKGTDYFSQGEGLNLKNPDTGRSARPDFVLKLPDERHIIIDAKVSLKHYIDYSNCQDDQQKDKHLQALFKSVKNHIDDLSSKKYSMAEGLNTPNFVILYMPLEAVLSLVIQHKANLISEAYNKGIVLASTYNLLPTFQVINNLWRQENQSRNVQEIARRGGLLYDKFANFIKEMDKIDKALEAAREAFDTSMGQLSKGRGNLVFQAKELKNLGAKTNKEIKSEAINVELANEQPSKSLTDHSE